MQSAYVNSGYARKKDDDYKTIDPRCIRALIKSWPIEGSIIDCCSPTGSGIVNELKLYGMLARGVADAFSNFTCDWIITNPPYLRPLVDNIVGECLDKLERGEVKGVAILVRANWDFAKSRAAFFKPPLYNAQIKMRFRPWWSEEREAAPIHNFVWHIWEKHDEGDPIVKYWP